MPLMALNASGSDKTPRARLVRLSRTPRAVSDLDQPGATGVPPALALQLRVAPGGAPRNASGSRAERTMGCDSFPAAFALLLLVETIFPPPLARDLASLALNNSARQVS